MIRDVKSQSKIKYVEKVIKNADNKTKSKIHWNALLVYHQTQFAVTKANVSMTWQNVPPNNRRGESVFF